MKSLRLLGLAALLHVIDVANAGLSGLAAPANSFLTGQLLVASSEMKDPRFAESIIYLVKHDDTGALGLVVNKPVAKVAFDELLKGFGIDAKGAKGEIVVHYGGPVDRYQGFVLHSDDWVLASSTKVKDGVAMTADAKMVQALADGKGPRQALLIMGYAGWAAGQLEMELKANSWFAIGADKSLVFGNEPEKKWRRAMDKRQIPL
ncbi:MAG TPA: YqgE/AlgH family protein [Candidatus Deferrimicrobium sp.]|nr:YqgE/AlgH family protein [Candidatus Deferrimicrobium sp.]